MRRLIYGSSRPYITEDERKLTEADLAEIDGPLHARRFEKHFGFLATRILPERWVWAAKLDRLMLIAFRPIARWLAGRILFVAQVKK